MITYSKDQTIIFYISNSLKNHIFGHFALRHPKSSHPMQPNESKWEHQFHTNQHFDIKQEPLPSEIQQTITAIQNRFTHISALDLISTLYNNLVTKKSHPNYISRSQASVKLNCDQRGQKQFDPVKTQTPKMAFTLITKEPKVKEPKPKEVKIEAKQFHELQAEADAQQDYDDNSSKAPSRERAKRRYNFSEYTPMNRTNLQVAESWDTTLNKQHRVYCYKVTPTFEKEAEQHKYYQKRNAALAYIAKGHGFVESRGNPEDHVPFLTDRKKQKIALNAFVNDTIRKFEYFLVTECALKLRPITGPEIKALFPFFLAPEESLTEDEYLIFRRFTKVTFEIGSVSIYERAAQLLYIKVQLLLQGKVVLGERSKEEKKRGQEQKEKKGQEQKEKKKVERKAKVNQSRKGKDKGKEGGESELGSGSVWSEGMLQQRSDYDPYPEQDDLFF